MILWMSWFELGGGEGGYFSTNFESACAGSRQASALEKRLCQHAAARGKRASQCLFILQEAPAKKGKCLITTRQMMVMTKILWIMAQSVRVRQVKGQTRNRSNNFNLRIKSGKWVVLHLLPFRKLRPAPHLRLSPKALPHPENLRTNHASRCYGAWWRRARRAKRKKKGPTSFSVCKLLL